MIRRTWQRLYAIFENVGASGRDTPETALQKRVLVAISAPVAVAAFAWGGIYFLLGERLAAAIPWSYAAASAVSIGIFAQTKRFQFFRMSQFALILLLPFLLQIVLGGFVNASAVILWALNAPLAVLMISGRKEAIPWFFAYAVLVVIAQLIRPSLDATNELPIGVIALFFVLNIIGPTAIAFTAVHYFVGQRDRALDLLGIEREKSDRLLRNVLPDEIASILREEERTIADHYDTVSVLFADVVGFTPLSEQLEPQEMVRLLNDVFSYFDSLVERYGVEKIRTIGDAYMVAAGVPSPREDHAHVLVAMSLDMMRYVGNEDHPDDVQLEFRIGISSGPAVAGVIGRAKFQYDLWGDTVNTASRMESHGIPGRIQIAEGTYQLVKNDFDLTSRGPIEVKGKGTMPTWFVEGVRATAEER